MKIYTPFQTLENKTVEQYLFKNKVMKNIRWKVNIVNKFCLNYFIKYFFKISV